MLAEFKKKLKEGGAKQHKGSGFGGRGFKFDTSEQVKHERSEARARARACVCHCAYTDCCCSMKKLQERLQKSEMGVSDSEDDGQQEALLKSSGLMPKTAEKDDDDEDSKVINLNHLTPGQQGVMVVVPASAANSAMYPNSAVSAAVQAAANAAAAGISTLICMPSFPYTPPHICLSSCSERRRCSQCREESRGGNRRGWSCRRGQTGGC